MQNWESEYENDLIEINVYFKKYLFSLIDEIFLTKCNYKNLENENKDIVELNKNSIFNLKFNSIDIKIIKNCRQLSGNLCGFHTIFNIKNFINYYKIKHENEIKKSINEDNSHIYYFEKIKNRGK